MTMFPGADSWICGAPPATASSASTTASSGSQSTSIRPSASSAALRRLGDDGRDAGAGERDVVDLERARRRDEVVDAGRLPGARERVQVLEVPAREDADDAVRRRGARRVDRADARVRVRRAQDRDVRDAGQLQVVEVARLAGHQARVLDPLDRRCRSCGSSIVRRHPLTSPPRPRRDRARRCSRSPCSGRGCPRGRAGSTRRSRSPPRVTSSPRSSSSRACRSRTAGRAFSQNASCTGCSAPSARRAPRSS